MYYYSVLVSVKREHRVLHHETYIDSKFPLTHKEVSASIMSKIPVDIRYLTRVVDISPVDPDSIQQLKRHQGLPESSEIISDEEE